MNILEQMLRLERRRILRRIFCNTVPWKEKSIEERNLNDARI